MLSLIETSKKIQTTPLELMYLQRLEFCSPFMARLLANNNDLLKDLLKNVGISYNSVEMKFFLAEQNIFDEASLKKALRKLRQTVLARTIVRDLNGLADLSEVMQTTTSLAEVTLLSALHYLYDWQKSVYGTPIDKNGVEQSLIIVGMGKLGGGELNVSSDVDLIFAYEEEGETQGDNPISNQDFFVRLGKKLITAIDDITEDGFVFRVDMRLRPFGSEGVLVTNLDALEDYYQNNGREWERYAWIKGREITGGNSVTHLLKPFVFRKYLDYGAFASMRDLKTQIQRDVNNRDLHDNIKLGRGGIREIEFIAQVFQLIRGGQDTSLQMRPTLQVLKLLQEKGLLQGDVVRELSEAYVFLRNLEHRLMYLEDQQTQDLPKQADAQNRIATAMNFSDWSAFMWALDGHREIVQGHFDETFSENKGDNSYKTKTQAGVQTPVLNIAESLWNDEFNDASAIKHLINLGYLEGAETLSRIQQLKQSHRYKQLPELSRQRFNTLLPMVIDSATNQANPDITLVRVMDFLEAICRRASYLALLAEYTRSLNLVVHLCGASAWCAQYLTQHPIVLDELLDERSLYAAPDFSKLRLELMQKMTALTGDTEAQMDTIRHFKHAEVFRLATQDVDGQLQLEILSDYLSALADLILEVSLQAIWQSFKFKHCAVPKFAIVGYGKLGSKELGYSSDLDIIFLYDDEADEAGEIYGRFAQRINNWFNSLTSAGLLYETDLQLRPDGNSGLLVSSVSAFRDYQLNRAWVWEHQAITRARFVAGDAIIGGKFEAIRREVICQQRDIVKLRSEVVAMREKMRQAQILTADSFDLKHSPGGIIDVEFIVQYLVLAHASQYADLTQNLGNITLLSMMGGLSIVGPSLAEQVANAYREYRRLQHAARLQGGQVIIKPSEIKHLAQPVINLWKNVFAI